MKLKKLVALLTAGALCLGMSLTAFAADVSREEVPKGVTAGDKELVVKPLDEEQLKQVQDDVTKILEDAGRGEIPAGGKAEVVVAADISLPEGDKVPEEGLQIEVAMTAAQTKGLSNGDKLYVLHWNGTKWEVLNGFAEYRNGKLYAKVFSFSPFAFVKVTSAGGQVVTMTNDTGKAVPVTPVKKASPKTGE